MSKLKFRPIDPPLQADSNIATGLSGAENPTDTPSYDGIAMHYADRVKPLDMLEPATVIRLGTSEAPQAERPVLTRTSGKDHAVIANQISDHLIQFGCMPDNIGPAWRMSFELAEGRISEEIAKAFRLPITAHHALLLVRMDEMDRAGLTRAKVKALLIVTDTDQRTWAAALQDLKAGGQS